MFSVGFGNCVCSFTSTNNDSLYVNSQISELVHRCATSIEARLPPYRRVAVLIQPHIYCRLEIETAREYCCSNFWSDSNRDCLDIEYSASIKTHEKMRNKQLFVPVSHDEIETS